MADMSNVSVYKIEIPANSTTGKLNVYTDDGAMNVDVDVDFTFQQFNDNMYASATRYVNTFGMNIGDTMFYPIFVGSADYYQIFGGTLPDEVGVIVLQITMVESLSDLDLEIFTSKTLGDQDSMKKASAVQEPNYIIKERLPAGLGVGTDEVTVYNYQSTVSTIADKAVVYGIAASE